MQERILGRDKARSGNFEALVISQGYQAGTCRAGRGSKKKEGGHSEGFIGAHP